MFFFFLRKSAALQNTLKMDKVRKVRSVTRAANFLDFRTYKKSRNKDKKTGNYSTDE